MMFYDLLATAIETAGQNQLDDLSRQVSRALGAGSLADDRAQQLYELLQCKRGAQPGARSLATATPVLAPRHFIQRSPEQRSPDRRASIGRRREHTATGPFPPHLARHYTFGQVPVLRFVAHESLATGACVSRPHEHAART